MTLVVMGIDALDPELVDPKEHLNLTLEKFRSIETITSSSGHPSTHELWPTIITGLPPEEHGLTIDDGLAWGNPLISTGSRIADYILPDKIQTEIGAWLLNNTKQDAFQVPATYYEDKGISTVFNGYESKTVGIPNYVTDPDEKDREHQLRKDMGNLFERDSDAKGGHRSNDPVEFYEMCMDMSMVRIARTRRALRSRKYELVFGYTSGLDLIGHVSYDIPELQERAYEELDDFVGELRGDLDGDDELLLVSDHGLQDGVHTHEAMIAGTDAEMIDPIDSVLDVRDTIGDEVATGKHEPNEIGVQRPSEIDEGQAEVREQLEDLGYM